MTITSTVPGPDRTTHGLQRLFLSYGHDEFEELATRLVEDLRATQRYEVWFDERDILPARSGSTRPRRG